MVIGETTILGRVRVGRGATVGGNVWVTEDVPAGGLVMQPPALQFTAGAAPALFRDG